MIKNTHFQRLLVPRDARLRNKQLLNMVGFDLSCYSKVSFLKWGHFP